MHRAWKGGGDCRGPNAGSDRGRPSLGVAGKERPPASCGWLRGCGLAITSRRARQEHEEPTTQDALPPKISLLKTLYIYIWWVNADTREGGLEKIENIWYVTYYNLQGRQVRRSSKSRLKSVAIEMLKNAKAELGRGIEPNSTRKLKYEDLRQVLLDDYRDKGRLVMDGDEPIITGRRGHLKGLDDYFGGMSVTAMAECSESL